MLVTIARLTEADAPAYRALMLEAYQVPDAFTSTPQERATAPASFWIGRLAHPQGLSVAFGAFGAGALVGTVTLEFSDRAKTRHKAHVVGMYVRPEHQGKGIGKALLDAAVAHAQALPHVRVLNLTVTEGNAAAQSLYERSGFEAFGTEPMASHTPDGFKAKVHMWKPLPETMTAQ
jgi:ribosomal protein S18 acetylase RimI-like enzyme